MMCSPTLLVGVAFASLVTERANSHVDKFGRFERTSCFASWVGGTVNKRYSRMRSKLSGWRIDIDHESKPLSRYRTYRFSQDPHSGTAAFNSHYASLLWMLVEKEHSIVAELIECCQEHEPGKKRRRLNDSPSARCQ